MRQVLPGQGGRAGVLVLGLALLLATDGCVEPPAGADAGDPNGPFFSDAGPPPAPILTVSGEQLLMGGEPLAPFGLRTANALEAEEEEENTEVVAAENVVGLVDYLPTYRHFAVGAIAIGAQATHEAAFTLYEETGALRSGPATDRLAFLLDATAANGVAVAVMLLRAGRDGELEDEAAVESAVRNATALLSAWDHVWIHALDDIDAAADFSHDVLSNPARHGEVLAWIRAADPVVPAVVGALGDFEAGVAKTASPLAGSGRPALVFPHPRGDTFFRPGVFAAIERDLAKLDAGATFAAGGYFFWHTAWRERFPSSWQLGRDGTSSLPGDLWLMEYFLELVGPRED